jgi:hypothetical protein
VLTLCVAVELSLLMKKNLSQNVSKKYANVKE